MCGRRGGIQVILLFFRDLHIHLVAHGLQSSPNGVLLLSLLCVLVGANRQATSSHLRI